MRQIIIAKRLKKSNNGAGFGFVFDKQERILKMRKNMKKNITKSYELEPIKIRKTVLDRYYSCGYLDMLDNQFNGHDRKMVGEMLAKDYYLGCYDKVKSVCLCQTNIPTTGEYDREHTMFYRERYLRAMKTVPEEFWPAVRRVCVEDLPLVGHYPQEQTIMNTHDVYHQKMLLNHGLDYLIYFYFKKI